MSSQQAQLNENGMSGSMNRVKEATSQVKEDLGEVGSALKGAAGEAAHVAKETAVDYYEKGREVAGQATENARGYVRRKPLTSALVAAGAGLVLGMFMSRRASR